MITGMYRDTIDGTYVEVRSLWGAPDLFACSWLDPEGALQQTTLVRDEIEEAIRLGHLVRDYRRTS